MNEKLRKAKQVLARTYGNYLVESEDDEHCMLKWNMEHTGFPMLKVLLFVEKGNVSTQVLTGEVEDRIRLEVSMALRG